MKMLILVLALAMGQPSPAAVTLLEGTGGAPITQYIAGAQHTLDCEVYEVTSTPYLAALRSDVQRGVKVRIVLEPWAHSTTSVKATGATVVPKPSVLLDHSKSCVRDYGTSAEEVLVGTANWSASSSTTDLDVVATLPPSDPAAAEIAAVIEADVTQGPLPPLPSALNGDEAVVSPVNSRALLAAFIAQPGSELLFTSEELTDRSIDSDLSAASKREAVNVAAPTSEATPAGAHRCTSRLYVHAKVAVLYRSGQPVAAFLGSENDGTVSLDRNREIGVIEGPAFAAQVAAALQGEVSC